MRDAAVNLARLLSRANTQSTGVTQASHTLHAGFTQVSRRCLAVYGLNRFVGFPFGAERDAHILFYGTENNHLLRWGNRFPGTVLGDRGCCGLELCVR